MSAGEGGGGRGALGALYVALQADASGLVRELSIARAAQGRTEKSMDSLDKRARGLRGGFMLAAGGAVAAGVGLAALANHGGEVDQQFARIQANSGATIKQMARMRSEAAAVGQALPTNMQDSADALYELTAAGYSADEATAALPGVSQLAVAGHLSQAEAANTVTSALNAYQLQANRSAAAADMLASVSAKSASEVRDLGEAESYVASTAEQAGLSLEDTTAWAGALSQVGQTGTRAGTAMNVALTKMIAPTEQGKQALDQLGLSTDDFRDKAGNLKSTYEIFSMLRQQMQGMSGAKRSKLLTQILGIRGARAVGPLVQPVKPGQVDLLEKMNNLRKDAGQAQVAGGINRLSGLSDQELQTRQQEVGFKLKPGSMQNVLKQYQKQAKKQDWSQAQLQQKLQVGLQITPDTSKSLASDIAKGSDIGKLSDQLNDTVTAQKLATAEMATFKGQVEQTSGALDSLFYNMWQGAAGPLTVLMSGVASVADLLSSNKSVAKAFGLGLVALGAASTVAAVGLGALYAEIKAKEFMDAAQGTRTLATAQYAQAAASKVAAAGEAIYTAGLEGNLTSLIASTAAEKGKTVARYASAAASKVATGASYAYQAGVWATTVATNGATAAEGLYTAALETETGAMIASRVAQLRGAAARYAAEGASAAAATAEAGYTAALETETGAMIASRASTLAATAATYGYETAVAAAGLASGIAAGEITASGVAAGAASGLMSAGATAAGLLAGGFELAAGGAVTLLTAIGPVGWILLGIGAIAIGIQTNFLGMGDAFHAVTGIVGKGVEAMLHPIQTLSGMFGALMSHGDMLLDVLSMVPGIGLVVWAARAAGGFDALMHPIDTVQGGINWLLNHLPKLPDPKDIPLLGTAIKIGEGLFGAGKDAGKRLSDGVAKGAKDRKKKVGKATDDVAREAADRLPSSNARRGPLSNLLQRGRALPNMLAKGMQGNSRQAGKAAGGVAARVVDALPGGRTAMRTAQSFVGGLQRGYRRGGRAHVPAPTVGKPRTPRPAMAAGQRVSGTATYRANVRVPQPPALPQGRAMPYRPRVRRPAPKNVGQVLTGGGQVLRRLEGLFGGGGRRGAIPGADLSQMGPIQHAMQARLGGIAGPNPLTPALDSARRISAVLTGAARAVSAYAGGMGPRQGHRRGQRDGQPHGPTRVRPRGERVRTQITRERTRRETNQHTRREVRHKTRRDTQRTTRRETELDRQRDTRRETRRQTHRETQSVTRDRHHQRSETHRHVRTRARRPVVKVSPDTNRMIRPRGGRPNQPQRPLAAPQPRSDVIQTWQTARRLQASVARPLQTPAATVRHAVPSATRTIGSTLPSIPFLGGEDHPPPVEMANQAAASPIIAIGGVEAPVSSVLPGSVERPVRSFAAHTVNDAATVARGAETLSTLPEMLTGGRSLPRKQPPMVPQRARRNQIGRRRRPAARRAGTGRVTQVLQGAGSPVMSMVTPRDEAEPAPVQRPIEAGIVGTLVAPAAPMAPSAPAAPAGSGAPATPTTPLLPQSRRSTMTVKAPGVTAVTSESPALRRHRRRGRGRQQSRRGRRRRRPPQQGRGRGQRGGDRTTSQRGRSRDGETTTGFSGGGSGGTADTQREGSEMPPIVIEQHNDFGDVINHGGGGPSLDQIQQMINEANGTLEERIRVIFKRFAQGS